MEIVIDASALLAVLLNEPERQSVIDAARGMDLLAPESLPFEVGNAVSALMRRKAIGLAEGIAVYHGFSCVPVRLVQVDLPESIRIASEERIYAYDAYLLSTAATYRAPLLSLDRCLLKAAQGRGLSILEV